MASILSIEQVLSLSEVDPTYQALLDRRGPLPALSGDVHVIRDFVNQMSESKKQMTPDDILEADVSIPTRDGQRIHARHYRPKIAPKDGSALVVMFHGGGNILGSYLQEEAKCRNFTQRYGCVCLNVDYRLAPEVTFPVPVQDCHDAVKWAAELAEKLGSRPVQGFIIGGTSAGANMADAVAHLCRDEKLLPTLTGELLLIPELLGEEVVPEKWRPMYLSWEQNKMADGLTRESIKYYEDLHKPDHHAVLYSPFIDPAGHVGIPPIHLQACGWDPYRDDSLIYYQALQEAGISTKLLVYPGLPHGFHDYHPELEASKKFERDTVDGLGWLLSQN